ncbi:Aldo/keto reductase [Xylariaceae sp. FL0255]|nr:Aldo/keto reductase [Xylariaceae sp. FL0255]
MATTIVVGKNISQSGFGLSPLCHRECPVPEEQSLRILKAALTAGVYVWNASEFYGKPEYNTIHLMNLYFTKYPEDADKVVLMVKGGMFGIHQIDCSAAGMRRAVDSANKILDGKKSIDVFGPARVDPEVPIEDTIRALAELKKEGKIGGIQLSEVSANTIERAAEVAQIDIVEEEVSLWATEIFHNGVAQTCAKLGIPVVAHTPLGSGMLTGKFKSRDDMAPEDFHRFFPRFQEENFEKNLELVISIEALATSKGCTAAQLALSWIKTQSRKDNMPFLITIPGSTSESRTMENATQIELSEEDMKELDHILANFTPAGSRFPEAGMKYSEF